MLTTIERNDVPLNALQLDQLDHDLDDAARIQKQLLELRRKNREEEAAVRRALHWQWKRLEAAGLSHRRISEESKARGADVSPSCVLQALQRPSPSLTTAEC